MTLETLLLESQTIRPEIQYVSHEICYGKNFPRAPYWAFEEERAFSGYSPEELLNELRDSVESEAA